MNTMTDIPKTESTECTREDCATITPREKNRRRWVEHLILIVITTIVTMMVVGANRWSILTASHKAATESEARMTELLSQLTYSPDDLLYSPTAAHNDKIHDDRLLAIEVAVAARDARIEQLEGQVETLVGQLHEANATLRRLEELLSNSVSK